MQNVSRIIVKNYFVFIMTLMLIPMFFGCGGGGGGDDPSATSITGSAKSATGSVTSITSGTIATQSGAEIHVPVGAVALTTTGDVGTVVFSIEEDTTANPTLPEGEERITDVYDFGPSGFVFQQAVAITIPVTDSDDPDTVTVYSINETTGELEDLGGVYDPLTHTVTAQTTHFSLNFGARRQGGDARQQAKGAIYLDNGSASNYNWKNVCPYEILNIDYPGSDTYFKGMASVAPPNETAGWKDKILYILPQGRYKMCVESISRDFQDDLPELMGHKLLPHIVVVGQPYLTPLGSAGIISETLLIGQAEFDLQPGPCPCKSLPTPSMGTGELMVTLTWHSSSPIDLDLWVTDPDGEKIYYRNKASASGGKLDRDNRCDNYENGKSENIYWASSPPAGTYKIDVNWYESCDGADATSASYKVRVISAGNVKTYSGTITTDELVSIDRISVN